MKLFLFLTNWSQDQERLSWEHSLRALDTVQTQTHVNVHTTQGEKYSNCGRRTEQSRAGLDSIFDTLPVLTALLEFCCHPKAKLGMTASANNPWSNSIWNSLLRKMNKIGWESFTLLTVLLDSRLAANGQREVRNTCSSVNLFCCVIKSTWCVYRLCHFTIHFPFHICTKNSCLLPWSTTFFIRFNSCWCWITRNKNTNIHFCKLSNMNNEIEIHMNSLYVGLLY